MAESRKVVEDATDWAEAQPDPTPRLPSATSTPTLRRREWTIEPGHRMRLMADGGPLR